MLYDLHCFKYVKIFMALSVVCLGERSTWAWEEHVFCCGWERRLQMSITPSWFGGVEVESFLIFCLPGLSISDRRAWKSPAKIVDLSISPCLCVIFCLWRFMLCCQARARQGSLCLREPTPFSIRSVLPYPDGFPWSGLSLKLIEPLFCFRLMSVSTIYFSPTTSF